MGVHHITYAPELGEICLYFDGPCNFSCHGCICRNRLSDIHLVGDSGKIGPPLSTDKVLELVENLDFKRVIFMGFEPTVNRDFPELARRLKRDFNSYNILLTNGYEFAGEKLVDEVCVSVKAATEEIFGKFTKARNAERVLLNFRRYWDSGVKLRAESILIPGLIDLDEIEKIARFIADVDAGIPYRIDGYIPMINDRYRRPTIGELLEAKRGAEKYLENVSVLHHGMRLKYSVRRIY